MSIRNAVVTLLIGLLAGVAGMWIGHQFFYSDHGRGASLHDIAHEKLSLTPEQDRELNALEAAFASRRNALENEMREANAELAAAIRSSAVAGPEVEAAVQHFHDAMGVLQAETIEHIFAIRRVLTPEQRTTFNERIAQALTTDSR